MVSGSAALLIEDFRAQTGRDPLPSTIKALLIHTASDLDDATSWYNPGLDYASGHGLIDVRSAADQLRSGNWIEGCVDQGETDFNTLHIPSGATSVKATLVWSDVAASPATTSPALVNDLDLVLVDRDGTRRHPWTLDPARPADNAVRTSEDHLNNVEVILADAGLAEGPWTLDVVGTSVPDGPQCFSLVYSGFEETVELDVDQAQLNGADQNQAIRPGRAVGQTFVVGRRGLLEALELSFSDDTIADLTVEILDMTDGDLAVAPLLGSVTVDCCFQGPETLDLFEETGFVVDLSSLGIQVEPGDALAFRLSTDVPCCGIGLRIALSDTYPSGIFLVNDTLSPGADVAFKTFVSVPEPATGLGLAAGSLLVSLLHGARRRRGV
jgi:hypothetical protein